MSSPISSALAKLDGDLQAVQGIVELLRAGLEVSDSQVSYSLAEACQSAATVRDLIRAESSEASWEDRRALEKLIHDLEVAAHEKRNDERRMRLLELADELEAGSVKHRSESRTSALNHLRQEAIQELRAEASIPEQEKILPGPGASAWLQWVCNLQEERDAADIQCLRTDFSALDHFAGEMEESYWVPGERVPRTSPQSSSPGPRPVPPSRRPPEMPAYTSPAPAGNGADYGRTSYNVGSRPQPVPAGNVGTAVAPAYDRPAGGMQPGADRRAEAATESRGGGVALITEPAEPRISAVPSTRYCEKCGASYSGQYHSCPVPETNVRPMPTPPQPVAPRPYVVPDKPKPGANGGNGAAAPSEARTSTPAPVVVAPVPMEPPKAEPATRPGGKKSKNRKQRRAEAASASKVTAPEPPEPAVEEPVVPQVQPESSNDRESWSDKESWTNKWKTLQESGSDGLREGKWRTYLFAPEALAVIGLLLLVVVGSIVMLRRKPSASTPAVAVETKAPTQAASTTVAPAQPATATTPTSDTAKPGSDAQAKQQDQTTAPKTNADNTAQKEATPPPAQVLSPPVEAPKTTTVAKKEEPAADAAPPGAIPGALPGAAGNMGSVVKDISANVPKLAGQKLRVSSGVAQGQLTHQVTPQYPVTARQQRVEGTVVLQAVIGKDGSVQKLSVVSGPSMLTKAAMEAVKQWRYRPFALNGEPVEADTQINVNFKLGD